jgi:Fe-S oxidoreductase
MPNLLILVDLFMNYNEPAIGRAMTETLEALGYKVLITRPLQSGRTHLSKGFVRDARSIAEKNIAMLHPYVAKGIPVVGQEPSEILTLRDEYVDLCGDSQLDAGRVVAANSYMFEEFILRHLREHPEDVSKFKGGGRKVLVHGHCHAKALVGVQPVMDVLQKIGYLPEDLKIAHSGAGSKCFTF